jgi:signal peptidase I
VSDHPTDLTRSAEPAGDLPPPPLYRPPVGMPASADAPVVAAPRRGSVRRVPSPLRNTLEWVAIVVVALGAAFLIKTFLIQAFYIPSPSMVPTLQVKDRVLVNKLSYDLHPVHRGDIVVFTRPPNEGPSDPSIKDLIKRVIGLPGDTIEARDGRVIINDHPLREPYLPAGVVTLNLPRMTVPAGQYFVMGDNRLDSKDSRIFGPISRHLLVGRAFVKVWPLSSIEFL